MTKKQINEETYSTLKIRYGIEKETDSFIEDFEELKKKAEDFTQKHFKSKLDEVQIQIIIILDLHLAFLIYLKLQDILFQKKDFLI